VAADPLSEALGALSQFLVADASLGDTLHQVAAITERAVPPAQFVGLTMLDERARPSTAVFTDPKSPEIDAGQYEDGEGPCLDAWRQNEVVAIDDLRERLDDYPKFARGAIERGIVSTLSLPLVVGDDVVGALNLYAEQPGAFSADDREVAGRLATAAAVVLANAQAYWHAVALAENLNEAMKSRAVIEQAKGILMAQQGLDADAAFQLLSHASQTSNRKLRDIAAAIVAGASTGRAAHGHPTGTSNRRGAVGEQGLQGIHRVDGAGGAGD
jgi:GAF domain-containing protein